MIIRYNKKSNKLHHRLQTVLYLVYAKRPLLEYEVISANHEQEATEVSVWQDGQNLGRIDASYRKHSPSDGNVYEWFAVTSDNVKKSRGRRNTKFSKDAKTAARNAIDLLSKKPLSDLGGRLIANMRSVVEQLRNTINGDYKNAISYNNSTLTNYFLDKHLGKNPPIPKSIEDQIINKELVRKKENLDVAENVLMHCKNNNGYALQVMKDETLLFVHMANPASASKLKSTYELDQYSQEKYTMLKVLEPNQFAADIGVKYDYDVGDTEEMWYFIVAGETKVM